MIRKLTALLICMLLTLLIPQSAFAAPVPGSSDRQITYREDNIEGNHYDYINSVNRSFFRKASDGYMRRKAVRRPSPDGTATAIRG